ncbi:unnamed protein product, partial [marine sediment metagenome]
MVAKGTNRIVTIKTGKEPTTRDTLENPASSRDIDTSDKGIDWLPVHELGKHLADDTFYHSLSPTQRDFWDKVVFLMGKTGHSPDLVDIEP